MSSKPILQKPKLPMPSALEAPKTGLPKVLFFYPDLGAIGGIERYIQEITLMLKARQLFEPVVICSNETPFFHHLRVSGLRVYGVDSHPLLTRPALRGLDQSLWGQIRKILSQERPALVHVHIGQAENLRFKRWGFPTVYTFHGYGPLYSLEATKNPLKRLYKRLTQPSFRQMARQLDAFLVVSQTERRRLVEEGYLPTESTAEVIHNGLNLAQWSLPERRELPLHLNLPEDSRLVSFINRLDTNKNPLLFIEMAELLATRQGLDDVYFLMAGDGPLTHTVRHRIAASPIRNRFRYVGYRSDVQAMIAASALIVHVPAMEGFGLGVLEAMALGIPSLAFASGAIPEVLDVPEASPLLVPPGDREALVRQAERLLKYSEGERETLAQALRARAVQYDLNVTVDKLEGVYRRVLHLD